MKRKLLLPLFAILSFTMVLYSCKKETSTDVNSTDDMLSANGAGKKVTRPMKVNFYSSADLNPSIPPTPCTGDLGLQNPGYFMHGTATHMGQLISSNSRGQDTKCDFRLATGLLNTEVAGQLAAANGDLLYYTGVDVLDANNFLIGLPEGTIKGRWTFTGGTGRFQGATGYFDFQGPLYFTPPAYFSFTGEGIITY